MFSDKLKNLIFGYILKDLYNVEIIYYRDSIWFIDRENRYWYFEYHKVDKHLWWRWSHFTSALNMFSMEAEEKQYLFGDLVNIILIKKQKLESKYPNKIFKTVGSLMNFEDKVYEVLNCEVETTDGAFYNDEIVTNEVLSVEIETIDYSKTHRLRPVTGALDYNVETTESVKGHLKYEVRDVLENTIEINSIEKLKGENPFQDIVVGHILDESDKVTDKLVIKEEEYVKTYSHDVYMCDHLVQNVLDVGVNSIHYDAEPHTQLVDGILKKSYNL
jgi:hypothetical protein